MCAVGQPDISGKTNIFCGLIAIFYSLKTKKIPAGRLVLGDRLRCSRVFTEWASLLNWESGSLLVTIRGLWARLQRGSVSFGGDLGSGLCFCGLGARLNKKKGTDAARISILAA